MSSRSLISLRALAAAFALGLMTGPALAQQDGVVDEARASGVVGEQADGYLGFPAGAAPNADLKARVDQVNIIRRKLYTESAQARGVTVDNMAAATACELFVARVQPGLPYRDESGTWRTRGAGEPAPQPSFCGQ